MGNRYKFFLSILCFCITKFIHGQSQLPQWQEGMMDIHHINTGRGNATYMVFPDGTSLLFDAGQISETHKRTRSDRNSLPMPNGTKMAYQWVTNYIKQFAPKHLPLHLNYAIISHFHDDHFGEWDSTLVQSPYGNYKLTGIVGVGDLISIENLIDRGHNFPLQLTSLAFQEKYKNDEYHLVQTLNNYFDFLESAQRRGLIYDSLRVGSNNQIQLKYKSTSYPGFNILNVAAAGKVATGYADKDYFSLFQQGEYPGENPLSICLKMTFGKFDYFTGGDIAGINEYGTDDLRSLEANVAPVIGPVDVATMNHHGNRDSHASSYVRTLRPRVWIQQTWSSDHPGHDVLRRITSTSLYPGIRDVFATDFLQPNKNVIGPATVDKVYKSTKGHIVVRVIEQGDRYYIYVLDDNTEERNVKAVFGPYTSR